MLLACAVVYLGVAMWFWQSGLVPGDALSRVANGYYTLFSRDPHLAAVGFVWNPLPSLRTPAGVAAVGGLPGPDPGRSDRRLSPRR